MLKELQVPVSLQSFSQQRGSAERRAERELANAWNCWQNGQHESYPHHAIPQLARRVGRDVKRVHQDAQALVALGLFEKSECGRLLCPYSDIHLDMHLQRAA